MLRQIGVLRDDRPPAFDAWLDRKLDGMAGPIRRDAERWLHTLKDGGPRSRPRAIATVHSHLGKALPALTDWSARYGHLREVTRDDIENFRWPGTANPHLLINAQTALGTGPASRTWINAALRGHAATVEALRMDRQLEEALASGADPLHLAATFGLDPGTAVRYASSARQLLQPAAEAQDPAGFPANPRTGSAPEP